MPNLKPLFGLRIHDDSCGCESGPWDSERTRALRMLHKLWAITHRLDLQLIKFGEHFGGTPIVLQVTKRLQTLNYLSYWLRFKGFESLELTLNFRTTEEILFLLDGHRRPCLKHDLRLHRWRALISWDCQLGVRHSKHQMANYQTFRLGDGVHRTPKCFALETSKFQREFGTPLARRVCNLHLMCVVTLRRNCQCHRVDASTSSH